jgi:hypothetical protein
MRFNRERCMDGSEAALRYGTEMKPCPFCFSRNVGLYAGPLPHGTCFNCGADGPLSEGPSHSREPLFEAFRRWNDR